MADAAEELEELSPSLARGPNKSEHSSMDFCRHIFALLELDTIYPREAREVNEKFEALLAYLDRQHSIKRRRRRG